MPLLPSLENWWFFSISLKIRSSPSISLSPYHIYKHQCRFWLPLLCWMDCQALPYDSFLLKDFTASIVFFVLHQFCPLCGSFPLGSEKAMAPHSSTLAWKIPWMEEPGRLQFMGSQRVGHDWATSLSLSTFMHWRRKWQPTPVFLPWESQEQGSLVGCRLGGRTESDTTEVT